MLRRINLVGVAVVLALSVSSSLPVPAADNGSRLTTEPRQKHGYGCHGAGQCAALLDFIGKHCKDWRCNNDSGKPSCWCEL